MATNQTLLGIVDAAVPSLYVADLDAAIGWYETVLGLEPLSVGGDVHPHAAFQLGGSLIVLEPIGAALEPGVPGSESTTINLLVGRDVNQVRADLLRHDVRCSEIVESAHYRSFLMRDPDGNRFYVAQPMSDEAQQNVARSTSS